MAEKNIKNQKRDNGRRNLLILLVVLILLILLGWLGALTIWKTLFANNEHFLLRNVELRDTTQGYWSENREQLIAKAGLVPGKDNIFCLNLRTLRNRITALPSVESCEVSRIMPDTLVFRLIERIPRASIDNPRSRWVLDANGIVMSRFESMPVSGTLPIITNFTGGERPVEGEVMAQAVPALQLLMTTIRNFPDISIIHIDVAHPDKLVFRLRYRNQRLYKAIIPRRTDRLAYLLNILQSTIINLHRNGDVRNTIDLSFSGDAVIR